MTLKAAQPTDLALGTVATIVPVPKKVWEGKPWNDPTANREIMNPSVVIGPYRVKEYNIAERAVFTAVDTYYRGTPKIDQIEMVAAQQPALALERLKTGQANWAPSLSPDQYAEARSNPSLSVHEWVSASAPNRYVEYNLR